MDFFEIVIFCIVTTFILAVIRNTQKEFSIGLVVVVSIIIFFLVFDKLSFVIHKIDQMSNKITYSNSYIKTLLKMTGIALLSDYTSNICKDSGENSIAAKIEFAGKILILFLSIPIILGLVDTIIKLLE